MVRKMEESVGKRKHVNQQQLNEILKVTLENDNAIPVEFPHGEFSIVRIWISEYYESHKSQYVFCCGATLLASSLSTDNLKEIQEAESKGHVSMELILNRERGSKNKGTYLSFGPQDDESLRNCFTKHPAKYIENYSKDLEYMNRPPHYTIIFYSLDVPKMAEALLKLINVKIQKWTLTGPRCNMGNSDDSCAMKTAKGVRFCWWSLCQCTAAFLKLPFHRVMITSENGGDLMDPTAELVYDKEGAITMSCVSAVFYILHKGNFTKLLPRKDQRRVVAVEVSAVSGQSAKNILQVNLEKVLRNSGYIFHLGVSSVVINPDAFLCIIKCAKRQEMKSTGYKSKVEFKNDNVAFVVPLEKVTLNPENAQATEMVKETVKLSEWIPTSL